LVQINKKVTEELQKIIEDGKERSVEYDIITKGGKIVPDYYGSGKLVKIGGESFFVGQTIDISEMKLEESQWNFSQNFYVYYMKGLLNELEAPEQLKSM